MGDGAREIRLTASERTALEKAAEQEMLDASTWARRVLLLEAKRLGGGDKVRGWPGKGG